MFKHRLIRTVAVVVALGAVAAPGAAARPIDAQHGLTLPHDFQTADTRDTVLPRGLYEPMRPENLPQQQDLRSADTRDYAEGRGTYNAPEVVVVGAPEPVAQPISSGIDWADFGIGAGSLLGIALMGAGGALFVVHRRGTRRLAA